MPLISAWKCPRTAKLFEGEEPYREHLRKLAAKSIVDRRVRRHIETLDEQFATMRKAITIPAIVDWIEDNAELFWINSAIRNGNRRGPIDPTGFILRDVRLDVSWSEHISNSHSAPFGKKTNWGRRDKGLPDGYPGFRGSFAFEMQEPKNRHHISYDWRNTGINTGTGGGGSNGRYRYDVVLWADDWPSLAVAHKLGGVIA